MTRFILHNETFVPVDRKFAQAEGLTLYEHFKLRDGRVVLGDSGVQSLELGNMDRWRLQHALARFENVLLCVDIEDNEIYLLQESEEITEWLDAQ